ncbi:MAG: cell division topological specificity factor MinE [Chloroflexota bacterium]
MGGLKRLRDFLASRDIARERLRLLLVSDRAGISPRMLECLKEDLLRVISEYVDIADQGPEFTIATADGSAALVASIPIKRLRRNWQPPERLAQ